ATAAALMYAGLKLRVHDVQRNAGGASLSMHAAVAMMMLLLIGPWLTVLSAAAASLLYDLRRGRSTVRMMGNLPTRIVPILLAGGAWLLMGGTATMSVTLPADYLPLLATVMTFAIANE